MSCHALYELVHERCRKVSPKNILTIKELPNSSKLIQNNSKVLQHTHTPFIEPCQMALCWILNASQYEHTVVQSTVCEILGIASHDSMNLSKWKPSCVCKRKCLYNVSHGNTLNLQFHFRLSGWSSEVPHTKLDKFERSSKPTHGRI